MKNGFLLILLSITVNASFAQINLNANLGGGVTYFENIFSRSKSPKYIGGPLFQAGGSISSLFFKDGKLGYEAGINVLNTGYYYVPPIKDETDLVVGWDYKNKQSRRDWYIQMPISLTFDVFEGTGFIMGGRINWRLTNTFGYNDAFKKWIPAGHIGIFTDITPRIQLRAIGFIDIPYRYNRGINVTLGYRELGGSLNLRYTLK